FEILQQPVVGDRPAVNFLKYCFNIWFGVRAVSGIVPGERVQASVARMGILASLLFYAAAQMVHKPGVAAGVAGGIDCFVMPLQHALSVGEGAVFLALPGSGEEKDLGADFLGIEFAPLYLGRVAPE